MLRPWTRALVAFASLSTLGCQSVPVRPERPGQGGHPQGHRRCRPLATAATPDFAAYVKHYYTEDATVLAANAPAVKGHAAIQSMLSSFPPMTVFRAGDSRHRRPW